MKTISRVLAVLFLVLASPPLLARDIQASPSRGPLELVRADLACEGAEWSFAGRIRGRFPAHASRRTLVIEARDDDGRVLLERRVIATTSPATVRHKHEWTAGFRLALAPAPELRRARWSVRLDP